MAPLGWDEIARSRVKLPSDAAGGEKGREADVRGCRRAWVSQRRSDCTLETLDLSPNPRRRDLEGVTPNRLGSTTQHSADVGWILL